MTPTRTGLLAGLLAGVILVGSTVALRLAIPVLSLPEVLAEWIITIMPPQLFSAILDRLKFAAKPLLLASLLGGEIAVGGLLGWYWAKRGASAGLAVMLVAGAWLATALVALPLMGAGPLGAALPAGPLATSGTILTAYVVYGLTLVFVHRQLTRRAPSPEAQQQRSSGGRRLLLQRLGVGLAALAIGGAGWRALAGPAPARENASRLPGDAGTSAGSARVPGAAVGAQGDAFGVAGLSSEITPTEHFYRVSKNFIDPSLDGGSWMLELGGLVDRPGVLSYDDLKSLPAVENFYTLECISNEVGGDLMGNAAWRGVRLRDLLTQAGVQQGVVDVVLHAADGYADSIPLELGLHPDTLLAYEMNGHPLTKDHGFPARLLVPGIFGMKNVKWVTRVELVDYDFKGFWQERGWSDVATYQTGARFDVPFDGSQVPASPQRLAGVAFAGDRGIAKVEVSTDGGMAWSQAELKPALSPYTWRLWSFAWTPSQPRGYNLLVRATDSLGHIQTDVVRPTLPDGATGFHRIAVRVG